MTKAHLPSGKLPVELLRQLLNRYHSASDDLILPPAVGEDAGVIGIRGGALVAATDPITLTGRGVGGHAVVINANDVAVMGVRPRWFLAVFLLPVGATESDVRELFETMQNALDRFGAVLVGGHTEITTAVVQPVVVGQMLGFREDGKFRRTGGVRSGDVILQIGPAPIEGAAVLANEAEDLLQSVAPEVLEQARKALDTPGISVVDAALRATALGATALHDPTEGGLSAGNLALRVDLDAVLWFAPGSAICAALAADPWGVLASGALLAAFPDNIADQARSTLAAEGYDTAVLAHAETGEGIRTSDGRPFRRYEQDEVSRVLAERQG
jgi:hydrogenase maturation factor